MTSIRNSVKYYILTITAALFFMSCASSKLKEPTAGEKPGAIAFGIFTAEKKFGQKPKLENQMASIRYVQYAEKTAGGYRHLLDRIMKKNSSGYWFDIASKQRQQLN